MLVESFNRTRWLDKLRPAGALPKADGSEIPMAPIVTTGILIVKKTFLTRHPCARGHVNLSVSFHGRSTICACHPCARAMQFSRIVIKKLQKRVAPIVLLCRIVKKSHARSFHQNLHSRIMRVILARGSYQALQILDVSTKTGAMLLFFFLKKKVCTCHPCTKGHAKFLCAKKRTTCN